MRTILIKLNLVLLTSLSLALMGWSDTIPSANTPPAAPRFIRTLYLIRHGAYDISEQQGDETSAYGLTPLGIAQARLVASRLRGMPVAFDSLTSSTLTRARQTADEINKLFPALTHEKDPLLCECLPPTRGGQGDANSGAQLEKAFAKYFIPAQDRDRHDIIVAHGNLIRALVMKALGVETKAWVSFNIAHGSLTIIKVKPDGTCTVLCVGDTGHIPPNMVSGLTRTDPQLVAQ